MSDTDRTFPTTYFVPTIMSDTDRTYPTTYIVQLLRPLLKGLTTYIVPTTKPATDRTSAAALVAPNFVAHSIFDATIDLFTEEGSRLYAIGSDSLPNAFSTVFTNSLANRAKKCKRTNTILQVKVGNESLHLLEDHGHIPMSVLKQLRQDRQDNPPTTIAQACIIIDSVMIFECIENSLESRVSTELHKPATSIDCDGSVMSKPIIDKILEAVRYTLFFGYACLLLPLREPPRKLTTDGMDPSRTIGPILLLLYDILLYRYCREPGNPPPSVPIFASHYTVDCSFGLACLLDAFFLEYSVLDSPQYTLFFGGVRLEASYGASSHFWSAHSSHSSQTSRFPNPSGFHGIP
jgi:hypothetical protein